MLSHTTFFKSLTVESITSSLQCITDTLKAARSEAATKTHVSPYIVTREGDWTLGQLTPRN